MAKRVLFAECAFVVASRPAVFTGDCSHGIAEKLRPRAEATKPFSKQPGQGRPRPAGVTCICWMTCIRKSLPLRFARRFALKAPSGDSCPKVWKNI